MSGIKLLHADTETLCRRGLKVLLEESGKFSDIRGVEDSEELFSELVKLVPDVLVIDYNQKDYFSVDDIVKVQSDYPLIKILVTSSDRIEKSILNVLETGVQSFLTRECSEDEILNSIFAIIKGEKFYCNRIVDVILQKSLHPEVQDCDYTSLTEREIEITKLVAEGMTSKAIASKLFISYHTVHTHRKNILKKLELKTTNDLTLYAINTGLVTL